MLDEKAKIKLKSDNCKVNAFSVSSQISKPAMETPIQITMYTKIIPLT